MDRLLLPIVLVLFFAQTGETGKKKPFTSTGPWKKSQSAPEGLRDFDLDELDDATLQRALDLAIEEKEAERSQEYPPVAHPEWKREHDEMAKRQYEYELLRQALDNLLDDE